MTANRSVRTGLTASAVVSVSRLNVAIIFAMEPLRDLTMHQSPGFGAQLCWVQLSLDISTESQGPFGLPQDVAP